MKAGSLLWVSAGMICLLLISLSIIAPVQTSAETGDEPAGQPNIESAKRIAARERRLELEKRLLARTSDDLGTLIALAARESSELEREADAVKPLELSVRKTDLQDFIDWYYNYGDWLKEMLAEFDADVARLSTGRAQPEGGLPERFAGMAAAFKDMEKQLRAKAKHFDSEGKRLARIVDRRRQLQASSADLAERLTRIERRLAERPAERDLVDGDATSIRTQISVVQSELLSLPLVDEDILMHYANLGERARGEGEWLLTKSDEYELLSDIGNVIAGDGPARASTVEAALARVRRLYERQIDHLKQRIDAIDRKRERLVPAGSLREVERSAELDRYYVAQKQRYRDYIDRLRTQLGAWEADLSELRGR